MASSKLVFTAPSAPPTLAGVDWGIIESISAAFTIYKCPRCGAWVDYDKIKENPHTPGVCDMAIVQGIMES
jgi:hypothetical protein